MWVDRDGMKYQNIINNNFINWDVLNIYCGIEIHVLKNCMNQFRWSRLFTIYWDWVRVGVVQDF